MSIARISIDYPILNRCKISLHRLHQNMKYLRLALEMLKDHVEVLEVGNLEVGNMLVD